MRLWGRDIAHQVRQLQHTSQCNHRNFARNINNLPRSSFSSKTFVFQLKATVRTERESLSFGMTRIFKNQNGSQSEPNQFPYQMNIWWHSLLSSNLSFKRGSLHLEISLHFVAPNKEYAPQNMALLCCLTYIYVIASEGVEVHKCLEKETKHRVSISNLSEPQEWITFFWSGHMDVFSYFLLGLLKSFAIIQNLSRIQGQEHTFLPAPSLKRA